MTKFSRLFLFGLIFLSTKGGHGWQATAPAAKRDSLGVITDRVSAKRDTAAVNPMDTLRKIPNTAYSSGEYLRFDVNYGFVNAGEAVMKISDTIYNGRKCHKIEFSVDSKPIFNWAYKVEDRYRTIVDAEGLFPWRFEQHIREGGYARDFIADFDQVRHIAKTSDGDHIIPPYVHDIMSAFYFTRTIDFRDFKPGQKIHLQNFFKDSTYQLDVKFRGRQMIEVDAGKFNCIVIEPLAHEGGLFKGDGKVYIWLTDDDRKIPIKVSTKIVIGSIDSDLVEARGIRGPIRARVKED